MAFRCTVLGIPLPEVEWVFVGEGGEREVVTDNITTLEGTMSVTSTLTLPDVQLLGAGQYSCVATNALGNDTALANLTVFGETS